MNKQVKKITIYLTSTVLFIFIVLIILPFAFKGKIADMAKEKINDMLNAKVEFSDVNLSFIRSFPNLSVKLENFYIIGKDSFAKDTLVNSKNIELVFNLKSIIGNSGYEVKKLKFNDSKIFAHVLKSGKSNWNIMKEDTTQIKKDTSTTKFNLKLKIFEIKNANIIYLDEEGGGMKAVITKLNHTTSGNLTADSSLLVTKTSIESFDFWMDGIKYLSKAEIELNADINANLNKMIFAFSKNTSRLNGISFSIDGWIAMLKEGYDMDLKLITDKVDFKSILSLVPAIYAQDFKDLTAGGKVKLTGLMKGKMIGDKYPFFDFKLMAENGWFKYPSLKTSVQNINVSAQITNQGKTLDATLIEVSKFTFQMGKNPFSAQLKVATPVSDPDLTLRAVGIIDFAQIKDIYPLPSENKMNGILDMNLDLGGKMSYYEKNQYDKFRFAGKLNLSNFNTKFGESKQDVDISTANLIFNNKEVDLTALKVKIGKNDISGTGKLQNLVAYVLKNQKLIGNLSIESNYMNINDFMSQSDSKSTKDTSSMKTIIIPKNINFTLMARFKKLVYGKMDIDNATGQLLVDNGILHIKNMTMHAFDGNMNLTGEYNTSNPKKTTTSFNLAVSDVQFTKVFQQVETFQKIAPIFEKATGRFSAKMNMNTALKESMMPDITSLIGSGSLSTKSIGLTNVPVLNTLISTLSKSKTSANTTLNDLLVNFEVKDGRVTTKPFDIKIGNYKMNLGGSTGLDKSITYNGIVQIPDNMKLGSFSKIGLKIGGTFDKPKVELDTKSLIKNAAAALTSKIIPSAVGSNVDLMKTANEQAEKIRSEAKAATDKLMNEANNQAKQLIDKSNNPITKKLASVAAQKVLNEAQKKADDINAQAEAKAKQIIQDAANKTQAK